MVMFLTRGARWSCSSRVWWRQTGMLTCVVASDGHVDHVAGGEPSSSVEQHVCRLGHYLVRRHLLISAKEQTTNT